MSGNVQTPAAPRGAELTASGKIKIAKMHGSDIALTIVLVVLAAVTVFTFIQMDYGDVSLTDALMQALSDFWTMATSPGIDGHFQYENLVYEVFVTFFLALLTTLLGAIVALILGVLAAINLSNRLVSNFIKIVMSIARAVPTILWVLVFTVAIGLGAEAAVIGMLFHSIAYLVKAYSESFEEVDKGVLEAMKSAGATWGQIVFRGVFIEKINEILSWTFIRFEVNFVAAVVVAGMAGSGGIGYSLFLAGNYYFDIHEIGLIVYLCLAFSVVLEVLATKLRKRYIVHK